MVSQNNFSSAANDLNSIAQTDSQMNGKQSGRMNGNTQLSGGTSHIHDSLKAALELVTSTDPVAKTTELPTEAANPQSVEKLKLLSWWTLKNKATLLAVALGTIPVLIVGGISTFTAGNQLSKEVIGQQQQFTNAIALQLQDFGARPGLNQNATSNANNSSLSQIILNDAEIDNLSTLVNQRIDNLRQGTSSEDNALRLNVIDESRNSVLISNDQADIKTAIDTRFPDYVEIQESGVAATFEAVSQEDNRPYLITYAPVARPGTAGSTSRGNELGVLVYQPMAEAFSGQQSLVLTLLGGTILTTLLVSTVAAYLANRATQPIVAASKAVEKLGQGKFDTRLQEEGDDELTLLSSNINVMAEQLEYQLEFIQDTAQRQGLFQRQATLAEQHQRQNEVLQRGLSRLTQLVEEASNGNLSARLDITDKEIASKEVVVLANTFNSVLGHLQEIVAQAKTTTLQIDSVIHDGQSKGQNSIQKLATSAQEQVASLTQVLPDVEKMTAAISEIASSAQQAEEKSRLAGAIAQRSLQSTEETAHTIGDLRSQMTEATGQIKQLGSASHQISQVISLINEIALKTNLLAVNASIEAGSSKRESETIKALADKVGQLSEQSTRATGEIERIVQNIQASSKEIVVSMETGTAQIEESVDKLDDAKSSLAELANNSAEIDRLTQSIAEKTVAQAVTSRSVADGIAQMKTASQQTADVSEQVNRALRDTSVAAQALAATVEPFDAEAPKFANS